MNISKQSYLVPSEQLSKTGSSLISLLTYFRRVSMFLKQRRTRARELRELHRFSDRELWDLGLSRSDIHAIENGVYRRG